MVVLVLDFYAFPLRPFCSLRPFFNSADFRLWT